MHFRLREDLASFMHQIIALKMKIEIRSVRCSINFNIIMICFTGIIYLLCLTLCSLDLQCRYWAGSFREATAEQSQEVELLSLRHRSVRPRWSARGNRADCLHRSHRKGSGEKNILIRDEVINGWGTSYSHSWKKPWNTVVESNEMVQILLHLHYSKVFWKSEPYKLIFSFFLCQCICLLPIF